MPHTMLRFPTVKARTGLSRSTIYLRISRGTFPAPVSLGGPCRGLDRDRGERLAHRADRATPADRAAAGAEDGGGGGRVPGAGTHTPSRRERVVDMIRNITVDGEEALAVDTAEELGRALLTGRYVVASDAVRAAYGLTDTDNSDTQDIVDESDWRDDAWRAAGGN